MKLLSYIKGNRKGIEAHRIEREAMNDPFLADALEGYEAVEGNHPDVIRKLQEQVKKNATHRKKTIPLWVNIAAGILIIIGFGIGIYIFLQDPFQTTIVSDAIRIDDDSNPLIKENSNIEQATIPSPDLEDTTGQEPVPAGITNDLLAIISDEETDHSESVILDVASVQRSNAQSAQFRHEIHGKVVDEQGRPLPGTNIMTKDRKTGTITDMEGNFELEVQKDQVIVAEHIGFKTKELTVGKDEILIPMDESSGRLNEFAAEDKEMINGAGQAEKKVTKTGTPVPLIGMQAYNEYLEKNIKRPVDDLCKNKKGKVIVQFTINEKGRPDHLRIKRSLCESSDKEAIRLINEGPEWSQGHKTVTVKVKF